MTTPIGATGLPLFSGYLRLDPNTRLSGLDAIRVYRDMAWNEPTARAFLTACGNLLRTDPVAVPGGDSDADKAAAEHLQACLDSMDTPVATVFRQLYSCLWAGWDIHEIMYARRDDGSIGWRDWGYRWQASMQRWIHDGEGVVTGWEQRPAPSYKLRTIPATRYLHVVADDSEGSPEGLSTLRGMYRPWHFVKNLELFMGISAERFGSGLPVFETEPGVVLTEADEAALDAIGDGLRQNERAWLRLPAGVNFRFAESPGLDVRTYLEIIRYLRLVMLATQLADFIGLGTQNDGGGGSYALGKDKSELFLLALNGYQQRVVEAINRQAVARLYGLPANRQNRFGAITAPPRVTLPTVKRYDLEQLSGWMSVLNSIGALTLTEEDEAHLRTISDLLDRTPAQIRTDKERLAEEARERQQAVIGGGEAPAPADDDPAPEDVENEAAEEEADAAPAVT